MLLIILHSFIAFNNLGWEKKSHFGPHFSFQVLFIVKISGESIVGLGKYNLVINYFF